MDCTDPKEVDELVEFLEKHYVEDQLGNFKLRYGADKIIWGIQMPGWVPEYHLLIRN